MAVRWRAWSGAVWLAVVGLAAAAVDASKLPPPANTVVDFTRDVAPIFDAACLRCHGAERPKGRFSLATRAAALQGGNEGVDIIPGDSAKSPIIHYVARLVPDMEMPPEGKGDPLTAAQVAVLRAWIDQGALWPAMDREAEYAQYAPQFSVTPAVRYVTVKGNAQKFQEHQWLRNGAGGGLAHFRVTQKNPGGSDTTVEGRALTDDYKITLDIRKRDSGFVRAGYEQFRRYYDDQGAYYPFRPSGFSSATRDIYALNEDLHTDIGQAFVEFGLTRPDWPTVVLGYEFHFRNGKESTEQWGPVTQSTSSGTVTRNIYPASQDVDEERHVLRLDVTHTMAGIQWEDNMRAEFLGLTTERVNATEFPAGAAYPSAFTITRETHDQIQFANALIGSKSLKDWMYLSAGYYFSEYHADATFRQSSADGAGRPVEGNYWAVNDIVLQQSAHVVNANALAGPWAGLTATLGVLSEWSEQSGFGDANFREGDPNDPTSGLPDAPGLVESDLERMVVEESLVLRYTTIPATVLFAEARWKQDQSGEFEQQAGDHDFLGDVDARVDWQDYRAGFDVSPVRWASLHGGYRHRLHESDYDHERDEQPPGTPGDGYPVFIRARDSASDIVEARLALRPLSWLKATLGYELAFTDYHTTTDPSTVGASPGGEILAGEHDSATYSAGFVLTPVRRWLFSTTFSYQESRTDTADNGSASVAPYRGDIYSVLARTTFAATARTDLNVSYAWSRARYGQNNAAEGLPLGVDYNMHGIQCGVSHQLSTNITAGLQYGFYLYDEPTAGGYNDYTANVIFCTLAVRWP